MLQLSGRWMRAGRVGLMAVVIAGAASLGGCWGGYVYTSNPYPCDPPVVVGGHYPPPPVVIIGGGGHHGYHGYHGHHGYHGWR